MDKILREKALKSLARSSQGDALIDFFEELIAKLRDSRTYPVDDFEAEGRASLKAAEKLEKVIRTLGIKKETHKPKEHKNYV